MNFNSHKHKKQYRVENIPDSANNLPNFIYISNSFHSTQLTGIGVLFTEKLVKKNGKLFPKLQKVLSGGNSPKLAIQLVQTAIQNTQAEILQTGTPYDKPLIIPMQ